jgi:hypothetical protein
MPLRSARLNPAPKTLAIACLRKLSQRITSVLVVRTWPVEVLRSRLCGACGHRYASSDATSLLSMSSVSTFLEIDFLSGARRCSVQSRPGLSSDRRRVTVRAGRANLTIVAANPQHLDARDLRFRYVVASEHLERHAPMLAHCALVFAAVHSLSPEHRLEIRCPLTGLLRIGSARNQVPTSKIYLS